MVNHENVLHAKVDNVKNISLVLKAINFKSHGVCFASDCGLKVVVEDSKCVQASAFIGNEIFQEYVLFDEDDNAIFRIDLNTLVECLTIFDGFTTTPGSTTALKMSYQGYGHPLKIILEEEGIITDCSLKTMSDCEVLDFEMVNSEVVCKVILRAPDFKDVFVDLDSSSNYVEFFLSPEDPYFKITTEGLAGKFEVVIPKNSKIVEFFDCSNSITARYRYSQIKPCLKSLSIAAKVSIRINEAGLICLQFMIETEFKQYCYVEYYVS
ncbi:hypothetical protein V9T40_009088 [Parthenolecanium corni]|uniref:Cell cycle checkpoint protein RAD1 n=1 Tax=Parthenolecanium corni TaxID=536013 RepID=A0AAN9TPU0_9HEMI